VAERVAAWMPAAVCLVSCSIESHARDLGAFARAGYLAEPFECFDMFPFSEFVESVTVLRRA
jgi:tRNA/tmRNA/rRNA uracil-C5-methylase (TrmA/RlmC/RlmD family)